MLIGEAPGVEEIMQGAPFVGASGKELRRMLKQAGIAPEECYLTNVFWQRPSDNKIEHFTDSLDAKRGIPAMPALMPGRYVNNAFNSELERLYDEIEMVKPNVIGALGNTACWAVLRQTPKIVSIRGRIYSTRIRGVSYKVLPTLHPAYILRNWKDRVIGISDLQKLKRESISPEVTVPHREILIDPTFKEATDYLERCLHANEVCIDVETKIGQITVIGLALSPRCGAVIPLWDLRTDSGSYWSVSDEVIIVQLLRRLLGSPSVVKIFQNGMYDLAYLYANWLAPLRNCSEDTMLLAHALWPELRKDLGTLASIHTNESSWKMMRFRNKDDFKRED
jgi:DNA polymerase